MYLFHNKALKTNATFLSVFFMGFCLTKRQDKVFGNFPSLMVALRVAMDTHKSIRMLGLVFV